MIAAAGFARRGSAASDNDDDAIDVIMAVSGPDFDRECGREDSNLQGLSPNGS